MLDWIKNNKKLVGAIATALVAAVSYLGYDTTVLTQILAALGIQ